MGTLNRLYEKYKAYKRGEAVIAGASRGRMFIKKLDPDADSKLMAGLTPTATLTPTRLYRAAEGRHYTIEKDGSLTPE
tara:strand:+ start:757 stop:990 length:234 start_codon:yes stop_codon:yes gene_type:complete